ncbi:hypothetical protein OG288_24350 [Streptomyces tauricus]|uniref:ATP-binding protein n=1 Tax=Streptomyces tauricus TaxID=68274 RepID=A0ABZ1JLI6_9ACTN|nr:hypothetical protein [Streptomyces tauricus]MCW8097296.1 hypothetical protein [Streptomyces tauricus]
MRRGLHGQGALFDTEPPGLAARLVGLRPFQHGSSPCEHPKEIPFVVFAGPRGIGRSAVLAELRAAYEGRTPLALIDCEAERFAHPPAGRPHEVWSPLSQALVTIAEQLAEPVADAGRIPFPRLAAGLLAVAAGGWNDRDVPRIRREAERILLLNDTGSWVGGQTSRWVGRVSARLTDPLTGPLPGTGPVVEPVVEAVLETFSEGVSPTHRRLRKAAAWYRDHPNADGNPKLGLLLLSGHFRAGGDPRTHAEGHLVRALLADLDDAYGGSLPRGHRPGRPVVLVDNAQTAPGIGLIGAVLRDRAEGIADRVAFFAGLRGHGHPALRNATRGALSELARTSGWEPGGTASSRALLVRLSPLSPDDTPRVVEAACRGLAVPSRLPGAAHRLTGGSPLGTTLFAESARQNLPRGAGAPGELLTADLVPPEKYDGREACEAHKGHGVHKGHEGHERHEGHGGRPAYRELLDRLVPDGRRDELALLAVAHDRESACALAAARLPGDFGAVGVLALEARLAEEGLPPVPGQFVGDPFLRALLLLELHRREPDHRTWKAAHRTLVAHYTDIPGAPDGPGHGPESAEQRVLYRLHHELALGAAEPAVTYLRDTFPRKDTKAWLRALVFLASAPYHPAPVPDGYGGAASDARTGVALGRVGTGPPPPEGADTALHLRIRRLLYGVWQVTDPLALPDPVVAERLRSELEHLSRLRSTDVEPLLRASVHWPEDALSGRPLRLGRTASRP